MVIDGSEIVHQLRFDSFPYLITRFLTYQVVIARSLAAIVPQLFKAKLFGPRYFLVVLGAATGASTSKLPAVSVAMVIRQLSFPWASRTCWANEWAAEMSSGNVSWRKDEIDKFNVPLSNRMLQYYLEAN